MCKRTHYRNGDEIGLRCGCDSCSPSRINGVICHESGCPDAWRDKTYECFECGCDFAPESRHQRVCQDCANPEPIDIDDDDCPLMDDPADFRPELSDIL